LPDILYKIEARPVFGPAVMYGLGGTFVEVMRDVTFRIAPFRTEEALARTW
jgi:acyl-CoA synthetase (NDP forming)